MGEPLSCCFSDVKLLTAAAGGEGDTGEPELPLPCSQINKWAGTRIYLYINTYKYNSAVAEQNANRMKKR